MALFLPNLVLVTLKTQSVCLCSLSSFRVFNILLDHILHILNVYNHLDSL